MSIAYSAGSSKLTITLRPAFTDAAFGVHVDADLPLVSALTIGGWDSSLDTQSLSVPYYTGYVWYSQSTSLFMNAWWDWHTTNATTLNETQAQYEAKTDASYNVLHEFLRVAVSPQVDDVFPYPGNDPSPYMSTMSGRLILDTWGPDFATIQDRLQTLSDNGMDDCAAIIHLWQDLGYDNGLPEHYPANSSLGGPAELKSLVNQGKASGCLMALHENYVDYYPNYPQFTRSAVALNGDGSLTNGWFNQGTQIQSYVTKASWMVQNASTQSPVIHQQYGTTAAFLDVSSAAPISSHGDKDAATAGASQLTSWMAANQALWSYERQTHAGPVLGEGLNHWYYSGLLDGVEAQLGAGHVPANSDVSLPLFVDFDVLRIHPLQVNHGMGYYNRWMSSPTGPLSSTQKDAYRMQEIAFGHAPFISDLTDVPHALVESKLVSPLAALYGTAHASSIEYESNGDWESSSIAAASGTFDRVKVGYDNGLTIVANSQNSPLSWNGLTIPQYGWAAQGNNVLAYTAMCGNTICDFLDTPTTLFANARNQEDILGSYGGYALPSVHAAQQDGGAFKIQYLWNVERALGTQVQYKVFVHIVSDARVSAQDEGIVLQNDHFPSTPTTGWSVGANIADGPFALGLPWNVADGTYSIRMGLFDPATGKRVQLDGVADSTRRYIVGHVIVSNGGSLVTFVPPTPPPTDPRLNASGTLDNFGVIQTDGMISLKQLNGMWIMRPFPAWRSFTVLLRTDRFPTPATISVGNGGTLLPIQKGEYWQVPFNGSKTYSWPVE